MSFKEYLSDVIKNSNLSLRQISDKCKDLGTPITPSYISQLQNGKVKPPTEEVATALAEVLNIDKNSLIIEAYLDSAPKIIKKFFDDIRLKYYNTESSTNKNIDIQNDIIKRTLNNQPMSSFILDYLSSEHSRTNFHQGKITIEDDSMEPLIPKGSQLIISSFNDDFNLNSDFFEKNANNNSRHDNIGFFSSVKQGDIIVAWDFNDDELVVGSFQLIDYTDSELPYMIIPMNSRYRVKFFDSVSTYFNTVTINNGKLEYDEYFLDSISNKINLGGKAYFNNYDNCVCIIGKVKEFILKTID